ncbi:MAG TPA: hypothetical protein PKC28_01440, partial [Bdellovibrionales bacterium]|nr:hypothetical protein [Bdellovibrionales bacterium]
MLFFVPALMTAGLLFVPGAWEFSFLRWIPYSSYEFFIVMIPAALLMSAARGLFKSESLWTGALWLFNFVYLLFFFSHPVQAFFYAFWSFAILKTKEKYPGPTWAYLLLLLLPMFLKHSAKEIQFWGLSYATFRAFHLAMEP